MAFKGWEIQPAGLAGRPECLFSGSFFGILASDRTLAAKLWRSELVQFVRAD
jgi:hypothetical protein